MAYTRKQIVTCLSIVYLILVTALAAYAACRASRLYIPIPDALSGFATALPIVAGLLLEGGYDLTRVQERRHRIPKGTTVRPPLVIVANTIIFIYSSVVATLLGTHTTPPAGLDCRLQERWRTLFSRKDSEAIRTIQEAFSCCGYVNSHDQAWPFPDKQHDSHACEKAFDRTNGCHVPWRSEEQRMAGILMAVVGLVFIWQFAIIAIPTHRESWLHRIAPERISRILTDEEHSSGHSRRAIGYLPQSEDRYRDNAIEEVSDDGGNTPQHAIEDGGHKAGNVVNGASPEGGQERPSIENVWQRD